MPGRNYTSAEGYRYGFNGMEKDDEVKGANNSLDFAFRIYDPRVGRFLSTDPLTREFPWNSPYAFAENDVVRCVDLEGKEKFIVTQGIGKTGSTIIESEMSGPLGDGVLYKTVGEEGSFSYTYQAPLIFNGQTGQISGGETYSVPNSLYEAVSTTSSNSSVGSNIPNPIEQFKSAINSESDNIGSWLAKFGGRMLYETANDATIAITSWAITQQTLGLESPIHITGQPASNDDRANAFVSTATMSFPLKKGLGMMKASGNYSSFVNKNKGSALYSKDYGTKYNEFTKYNRAAGETKAAAKGASGAETSGSAAGAVERDED